MIASRNGDLMKLFIGVAALAFANILKMLHGLTQQHLVLSLGQFTNIVLIILCISLALYLLCKCAGKYERK